MNWDKICKLGVSGSLIVANIVPMCFPKISDFFLTKLAQRPAYLVNNRANSYEKL